MVFDILEQKKDILVKKMSSNWKKDCIFASLFNGNKDSHKN